MRPDLLIDLGVRPIAPALPRGRRPNPRAATRVHALAAVSRAFSEAVPDYDALLRVVAERVAEATGDACMVRLLSDDGVWLHMAAIHHPDPALREALWDLARRTPQRADSDAWTSVIAARRTARVDYSGLTDAGSLPHLSSPQVDFLRRHAAIGAVFAPLVARGRVLGGIALVRFGGRRASVTDQDEVFLADLAERAALAIDNARLLAAARTAEERLRALNAESDQRVRARTAEAMANDVRFRAVFEQAMDGILLTSTDGRIHAANPAAERLYGMTEAELIAAGTTAVVDYADPRVGALVEERRRTGVARSEVTAKRRDGGTFPAEVASAQYPGPDGVDYVATIIRDLTEEKRIEAEREELARAKDEMVAVVSHELRTPLSSLVGFAEPLLAREFPEAERREFLGIMLHEGQRLTALINDFLDVQRLENGRQRLAPEPTPVGALLERALAAAGDDPAHPTVLDVPEGLPPVLADVDRIQQVLMNLLSNARKYSPGRGRVTVAARVGADAVEIAVSDEGLGIPPEALPKLFEKFYRIDAGDRREIGGTGLGLAIVKGLVEAHGGRVRVASGGPGRGSTFAFSVPVADGTPVEARGPDPSAATPRPAARGDVLVVEDDPSHATWLACALEAEGYAVRMAAEADAALEAITAARPGALLLDLHLPGKMDGWDLLAVLRGRHDTHDLPVVVVSAYEEQERDQALSLDDYLVKPVQPEHLRAVLDRLGIVHDRWILVVEDDPSARALVLRQLEEAGRMARAMGSGGEALALLAADPASYGLVVIDLGLPDMDGLDVLYALRAAPATRALPVVVHTASDLSRRTSALSPSARPRWCARATAC